MMNKKLLRQIKQEGFHVPDYNNDILTNHLIADYTKAHEIPLELWTNNQMFTRLEELYHTTLKLSILFPEYYREEWYGHSGEYYDIMDEIDNRYNSYYHHRHEEDY